MNVPNAIFGFQYAHTGIAMAGLGTFAPSVPSGPNYREFIGTHLLSSLVINQKYFFSFYTNFANTRNVAIAANKIGLRFSTVPFDSCCHPPINNFAHLYTDSIVSDSISWTRLSASFIADSAYNYVTIGNFFDDAHTDTLILSQFPGYAYYYIDDVCVTTDSLFNETWTGMSEHFNFQNSILIFPNPTPGELIVKSNYQIDFIRLINSLGQTVLEEDKISSGTSNLSLGSFQNGLYYIQVKAKKEFSQSIINLIH